MVFPERNVHGDKRELLENYLNVMREKEREKLEMKRKKIEFEREQLNLLTKQIVKETDLD